VSNWGTGYTAQVTVTNTGLATITGWKVGFDLDVPITGAWSAVMGAKSGSRYSFTNESWNGKLLPGKSTTFGFQTSSSADITVSNLSGN